MEKLVKFYSKDPKSQEKAQAELDEQEKKMEIIMQTKELVERQLMELQGNTIPLSGSDEITTSNPVVKARALYNYQANNDSELSFKANDILDITEQDESGWWLAELNGVSGFIPSNYMSLQE